MRKVRILRNLTIFRAKKNRNKYKTTRKMMNYLEFFGGDNLFRSLFLPKYTIEALDGTIQTSHFIGETLSKLQVMGLFEEIRTSAKNNYYVGITCNPERREKEHKADFLAVLNCPSVWRANELEKEADKYGFDAGKHVGNATNMHSTKVYIYKKTDETKE